ncbi:G-protein coupled receptor Mth-like [Drosophila miranda]|uniref:G-protein coupled receptor Mth-like n=1 Tax=Drosophila miranda TaxID=7229 RepID=UPI0007E5BDE9|nr:G-protein coupled receptor Mth-like [Drosophila miranda]
MANFLWLSVISWNLRSTFSCSVSPVSRYRPKYVSLIYNVYAWGMASVLTAIIYMVDHLVEDVPENEPWMPGVGFYNCWINTQDWSAMLYFFGPMLIVIIFTRKHATVVIRSVKILVIGEMSYRSYQYRNAPLDPL